MPERSIASSWSVSQSVVPTVGASELPWGVLDGELTILHLSRAMEWLVGLPRHDLVGRPWIDVCVATEHREAARAAIAQAPGNTLVELDSVLTIADGGALPVRLRCHVKGMDAIELVLVEVASMETRAAPLDGADDPAAEERGDASFGQLLEMRFHEICDDADLTQRERALFPLLVAGRSLAEIASDLAISERTVKFHQSNLLRKLAVGSRLDLPRLLLEDPTLSARTAIPPPASRR